MASFLDNEFSLDKILEDDSIKQARGGDVPLGEYFIDFARGGVKGIGQAAEGLLQLGAMPIDFLFDTNALDTIEKVFDKITPETTTSVGDITSILVQFGIPGYGAVRVANGMAKLKGLSTMKKLDSLPTFGSKGMEIAKRSAYFGGIGGLTDLAVSTPGSISTLSEDLGIFDQTELEGLEGRERAAETLKSKLKFGAEGTIIGGGIPLLPVAGSLGVKYGLMPTAKAVGFVGGNALRVVDRAVVNPLSKAFGSEFGAKVARGDFIPRKIKEKIDGVPSLEEFRFAPAENGFKNTVLKGILRIQDQFTTAGPLSGSVKNVQTQALNKISAEKGIVERLSNNILQKQEDLIKDYKIKLFDKGESLPYINYENTKISNFLKATKGTKNYNDLLKSIDKRLHTEVKLLKKIIDDSTQRYKDFVGTVDVKDAAVLDFATFTNQRLGAFKNSKFKFDPTREAKAVEFFKDLIIGNKKLKMAGNPEFADEVARMAGTKNKSSKAYKDALDKFAKTQMLSIKSLAVKSNAKPQTIFKEIAKRTGVSLKEGETFDSRIRDLFSKEKDAYVKVNGKTTEVVTSDFKNAALDTIINQSEQIYGKRVFDFMLEDGLKKGWIFTEAGALARGIDTGATSIQGITKPDSSFDDILSTSEIFAREGDKAKYFTNKEIAKAIVGAEEFTGGLYRLPFYKGIMQLKAGAQISKTILSPMTQIRNFTTASFFPLASGLIGGPIKFKDAFKIVADDIFQGAKTDADKLARIEELISRGVIDQNIQVQEMKKLLDKAQGGKLSFNGAMESKVMRKLTDIYQGSDNIWKVYTDNFYQGALKQAFGIDPKLFREMAKETSTTAGKRTAKLKDKFMNDVKDWYKTVAGEDFVETNVLTGAKKTPEEALEEMSAWLTTNTVPTYSKVPQIIKEIRNLPFGNFIAFPAEILRTTSNIVSIGARELTSTNPLIRQMGARRLMGVSTVLGGIGTVVQKTAQQFTGVDDETMDSFQRSFAPSFQKNSTLIPLTAPDRDGKFKYFNFSYSNPYDSLVTPVNAILGAYSDGRLNKSSVSTIVTNALFGGITGDSGRKGAITEFITPFVTESIGTERAVDVTFRNGVTQSGKRIYYPNQDSPSTVIAKSIDHVIGGLTPGAFTSAQRIWEGATGTFTDYGTARNTKTELAALLSGVRIEEAKPLASMPFIITSFNRDKREISSEFGARAYSANTTPEQKIGAFREYVLDNFTNQKAMYNTIQDARNLGISTYKLEDLFKGRRMTKSEVNSLLNGEFKAPTFSKNAFKALAERLRIEDPFAASRIERQNEIVADIFEDLRDRISLFNLNRPLGELEEYIDAVLSPNVERAIDMVGPDTVSPNQAPVELPSQITGNPVNTGILSSVQNLGQRFNLTTQLNSQEKQNFLFPRG
jgi:Flp pilus assembly protein TadG